MIDLASLHPLLRQVIEAGNDDSSEDSDHDRHDDTEDDFETCLEDMFTRMNYHCGIVPYRYRNSDEETTHSPTLLDAQCHERYVEVLIQQANNIYPSPNLPESPPSYTDPYSISGPRTAIDYDLPEYNAGRRPPEYNDVVEFSERDNMIPPECVPASKDTPPREEQIVHQSFMSRVSNARYTEQRFAEEEITRNTAKKTVGVCSRYGELQHQVFINATQNLLNILRHLRGRLMTFQESLAIRKTIEWVVETVIQHRELVATIIAFENALRTHDPDLEELGEEVEEDMDYVNASTEVVRCQVELLKRWANETLFAS